MAPRGLPLISQAPGRHTEEPAVAATADYSPHLQFAVSVALSAGALLRDMFGHVKIWEKGPADLLTEADLASQHLIADLIAGTYPNHTLLAEEEGAHPDPSKAWRWIVDPLDGTVNFAHGNPLWCVSIGLEHEGELVVGVVHAPLLNTTHAAARGRGTTLNDHPVRVSSAATLSESLISTGFPSHLPPHKADHLMALLRQFSVGTHSVRRTGTSAWNLAMVASGGFDAYYGTDMHPWDSAAGTVLVREAGGTVTGLDGQPFDVYNPGILATNTTIHHQAVATLKAAWPKK
jgi:myo-inositol-1(or 4)-monophosphatase